MAGLNSSELAYARLLVDPCQAPLTHSLWPGSNGTMLQRFESDFLLTLPGGTANATSSSAVYAWVPGASVMYYLDTIAGNVAMTDATNGVLKLTTGGPGENWFNNNGGAVRCLGACAQVFWAGSENARAGVVSFGVVPAPTLFRAVRDVNGGSASTDFVSAAGVRSVCPFTMRMPQNKLEVKWFPGSGDAVAFNHQQRVANAQTAAPDMFMGRNALVLVVNTGGSTSVDNISRVRIRLVSAIEWSPHMGLQSGITVQAMPQPARGALDKVLSFLQGRDMQWYLRQAGEMALGFLNSTAVTYSNRRPAITMGEL